MKNISRLAIAALIVGVLVVVATGVWAAPKFQGTVPPAPESGSGSVAPIEMGTALFTPACTDCTVNVAAVSNPAERAAIPDGKQFVGDAFEVTLEGTGTVKITFALPTELAGKEAKIYKLDTSVTPNVWVEVPGAVTADGTISVNVTEGGIYCLIANQ